VRLDDDAVLAKLAELNDLAPLHNPPALEAIAEARRLLPDVPHVAAFDTAFHRTIPPFAPHLSRCRGSGPRSGAFASSASTG